MRRVLGIILSAVAILVVAAFIYVKISDTKMMTKGNPTPADGKIVNFKKPSFSQFKLILDSTDDEIVNKFGEPDQVIETGPDSIYYGYVYQRFGITAIFGEENNKPLYIECARNVKIKKARPGMNYAQIQKRFGKGKIIRKSADTWILSYKLKGLLITFKSNFKDGQDSKLLISKSTN